MDTLTTHSDPRRTTRSAEGLDRRRWTTPELVTLRGLGMFADEARFELFDGEIVPIAADGRRHARRSRRSTRQPSTSASPT